MKSKHNSSSSIYQYRGLFFSIGLVISLLLIITAFEWKSYEVSIVDLGFAVIEEDVYLEIPPTRIDPPKPMKIVNPVIKELEPEEINENIPDFEVDMETIEIMPEIIDLPPLPEEDVEEIPRIVEKMPEPKGGYEAFYRYLYKQIKYPKLARRSGVQGRVFVSFVIDTDGSISDVELVNGIGAGCDEETIRALKLAPNWNPGKQRGVPVKVRMIIPITFRLE